MIRGGLAPRIPEGIDLHVSGFAMTKIFVGQWNCDQNPSVPA
jgi:hypothetical protein